MYRDAPGAPQDFVVRYNGGARGIAAFRLVRGLGGEGAMSVRFFVHRAIAGTAAPPVPAAALILGLLLIRP